MAIRSDPRGVAGGELVDSDEGRTPGMAQVGEGEEAEQLLGLGAWLNDPGGDQCLDLGGEPDLVAAPDQMERFLADAITGQENAWSARVPHRKRKHTVQPVHAAGTPPEVGHQENLSITSRSKPVPVPDQILAKLEEVVDLPVEDQHTTRQWVRHRLVRIGRKVEDAQPGVTQRDHVGRHQATTVRASVGKRLASRPDQIIAAREAGVYRTDQATHHGKHTRRDRRALWHHVSMAGWDRGARRRFVVLASARVGAQGLSIAWFLLAARALSEAEFGLVSTGLTFLAVLVGIGDLGMSRTIVRHVAVDHSLVWPMFRAAVPVRVLGTAAVAVLAAIAVAWADVGVPTEVVLVAGGIAVVSGITELAYAGLRATGAITVEVVLMLSERGLFLVGGVVVLARGGGAIGVLLLYLLTNGISATAAASRVYRRRPPSPPAAPWVLDVEARVTAMAFALVTIGPRVAPLLLALLATPADVGIYAVAQRPMEAVTLFTLSTAAPLLPIVRERYGAGHDARGDAAALSVLGALSVCLAPLLSWFIIDPSTALTTLFGPDRYLGADTALRLLAITALTWTWRGVGEAMLLAGHRAQDFLRVNIAGTVTCLAVGLPSVLRYRSAGAAMAVVSAELVMTLWLVHVVPAFRRRKALPFYVPTVLAAGLSGGALIAVRGQVIPALALVVAFTAVALAVAIRMIKDLELR